MKIICAGFSKTGTKSLAEALRTLGFTVHDFDEHMEFYLLEYTRAYEYGIIPDFGSMYSKIDAITDVPASSFWKEIKDSFPHAKVILMERDNVELWLKSMLRTHELWCSTIATQVWLRLGRAITPTGRTWKRFDEVFMSKIMKYDEGDQATKSVYIEHNARVKATIPEDKLLVFSVKQGWEPLCKFLGVEIPDEPFPHANVNSAAIPNIINHSAVGRKVFQELILLLTVLLALFAVAAVMFVKL